MRAAAAAGLQRLDAVGDLVVGRCRIGDDRQVSLLRDHVELNGLQIDEQRRGQNVVGPVAFAVEVVRVGGLCLEHGVIDDHVAVDVGDAAQAYFPGEALPAIRRHERVAAAAQHEVALDVAGDDGSRGIGARGPDIIGTEFVQCGIGRYQLDRRCRAAWGLGIERKQRLAALDVAYDRADGAGGDVGLGQCLGDGRRYRHRRLGDGRSGEHATGQRND